MWEYTKDFKVHTAKIYQQKMHTLFICKTRFSKKYSIIVLTLNFRINFFLNHDFFKHKDASLTVFLLTCFNAPKPKSYHAGRQGTHTVR